MQRLIALLLLICFMKIDYAWTNEPSWLWLDDRYVSYDPENHWYIDDSPHHYWDAWEFSLSPAERQKLHQTQTIPCKRRLTISVRNFWYKPEDLSPLQAGMAGLALGRKRFVLLNPESSINEFRTDKPESRCWPHLGMLCVGTVADQEGWEVSLYDELVEGYVDLPRIVQPGDVVGLSLVVSGTDRGVALARQAKELGARYVIAGNDSAIFRTDQLLRLPDRPIDAVFKGNSLTAVREFLRQIPSAELMRLDVPGVAIVPTGLNRSNESQILQAERDLRRQLRQRGAFDEHDVFIVPKLGLFSQDYWQTVWRNYQTVFTHKHTGPVRNALSLFAQGCTRTGSTDACSYCTIAGVADLRMPTADYLDHLFNTYEAFGINYLYNTTDSVFEMGNVLQLLDRFRGHSCLSQGLIIYGRARGLATRPELIDKWRSLTGGRLLVNSGFDSGDERILSRGVVKASQGGSRLQENHQAIRNIKAAGAHLHYALIFGSPGETHETCRKTLEFFEWTRQVLGSQLDQCETDFYWLNHGSPASRVFRDYVYTQELAALAGKEITHEAWEQAFHRHRDSLVVPWECEEAWYHHFTQITADDARNYNNHVAAGMATHTGATPGRGNAFLPG